MSSNVSDLRQASDLREVQEPLDSNLRDHDLIEASADDLFRWWDAPIPNRLTAGYHIGRLLNSLSWYLQLVLFGSRNAKLIVERILNRLDGISYLLVDDPPNRLSDVVKNLRDRYPGQLNCESAAEDVISSCFVSNSGIDSEENIREELFQNWVCPLLRPVRACIWEKLSVDEQWAYELGGCLDGHIRHPELWRFVEARRYHRTGYYSSDAGGGGGDWSESGVEIQLLQPKVVDQSGHHKLRALLDKIEVPQATFQTFTSPCVFDHLDRNIRGHLRAHTNAPLITTQPGSQLDVEQQQSCHVTLVQMAAMVNKTKPTLERLKEAKKLPHPDVKGGNGKADEWLWSKVRPVLEQEYSRSLPDVFPGNRFARH